ncbi:MAG: di-heme oxidoredictase family protein [Flavobacteriales bacterium]
MIPKHRRPSAIFLSLLLVLLLLPVGCSKLMPDAPADDALLDGPVEGLNSAELQRFLAGDAAFNDDIFSSATGLGPLFVASSCGSCHAGDGKGHPLNALTRFGQYDASGNQYLDQGGPQLQHRAIPGYSPEIIPAGAPFAVLLAPANTGLGFLDAVSDADILAMADPADDNGDGISGVPNWITPKGYTTLRPNAIEQGGQYIGRFGKKGATYDLLQQTATAYAQDIGVNSAYEPIDVYSGNEMDPEVSNATVHDVVFYLQTLKAPIQREQDVARVIQGAAVFTSTGCASCHVPELSTGASSIGALSNKTFRPYTDLLLHDMGPGLDDGYTEGSALTGEWRTPPLWGLGLAADSQGGALYLMHDGRAGSIEQAIAMHGGEAMISRDAFLQLLTNERDALLHFLNSL